MGRYISDTVLLVDDDKYVLDSFIRLFADSDIKILRAANADEALEVFGTEEVAVIISDNHIPGMKGIDLLTSIRDISPDTLKMIMTGYADIAAAVNAINTGDIFRFITKPWNDESMVQTVHEALKRYQIIQSLKREDDAMLLSIAQSIELKDPHSRGHYDSVARYALRIADAIHFSDTSKKELRYACWLHDCGKIGVPAKILNKEGPLTEREFEIIKNHPRWGADVARQAKLSDIIVKIILHHHERYDGSGYPAGLSGDEIPLEARIVTVADVFDALTSDRPYKKRYSEEKAITIMSLMNGSIFDPAVLDVFLNECLDTGKQPPSTFIK